MSEDGFSDSYDEPNMDLFIETLTGTTFEMKVYPTDTILDIKKKIHRVEGIPVHQQNLLFRLQEVEDYNRLCDIGLVNGSTLKLVLTMRGGPISTRRLSSCDHHLIWRDLKDLIEHTREELGDKLSAGAKVSVLVFKDGDVINLIRVIENDDGTYHPYGDKPSSSSSKLNVSETGDGVYNKMQEQNTMLGKLSDLRKKMADASLKRNFKNSKPMENEGLSSVGCIGEKPLKDNEDSEQSKGDKNGSDSGHRYCLLDQFRRDAASLLKLHESQFCDEDEEEDDSDDLDEELEISEDSIALKEKHRGKNSFYNILFQDPSLRPEKPAKSLKTKPFSEVHAPTTLSKETKENSNLEIKSYEESLVRNAKLKEKHSEISDGLPNVQQRKLSGKQTTDEKMIGGSVLSPLYNCFNSNNCSSAHKYETNNHKFDTKINLPDITCDLNISPPTATSLAESIAIINEEPENDDKEVLSPIGVPCAGTLSMSKVPTRNSVRLTPLLLQNTSDRPKSSPETVNIEEKAQEICDIFTGDSTEGFRSNKLGILKRWQSVDCSTEEVKKTTENTDYEFVNRNCYLPSLFPTSHSAVAMPKNDCVSDLYFGNRVNSERISRSPLYRRYSRTAAGKFSSESGMSDNLRKNSDNHRTKIESKYHDLGTLWPRTKSLESSKAGSSSKCDMLNVDPLSNGALYNFINTRNCSSSSTNESKYELNPLRIKSDSKKMINEFKSIHTSEEVVNNSITKIAVDTTKLDNLPTIIEKKRMRCAFCNKKLNITNMYDCRCGGIFCGQHRYSEVHYCNYDYKTEGRKLLEQQNPVIVADKLNKL